MVGIHYIKTLLHPGLKQIIDIMIVNRKSYIGISGTTGKLFIDNQPVVSIKETFVEDIKTLLADDARDYEEMIEYRLTEQRKKEILTYYQ